MKRRVVWFLLFAALSLGVSGIAVACGGGKERLSVEEYFQRLQAISDDLDEQGATLDSEFEAAVGPGTADGVDVGAVQKVLAEGGAAFRGALDDLESLNPPSSLEDAHRTFVEQVRVRTDLIESLAQRATEAQSASDLGEVFAEFESPELEQEATRFSAACQALEGLATDNGIQVSLNCE